MELKEYKEKVEISLKEYNLIQVALWTLKCQIDKDMANSADLKEINSLYVYAQEITELKHDLKDVFDIKQDLL